MLALPGQAGLLESAVLGLNNLALPKGKQIGQPGSGSSRAGVQLLLQFAIRLSSDPEMQDQLRALLSQTSQGRSFSDLLETGGVNRHVFMASLPQGIGQTILSLGCENNTLITCQELYQLACGQETSWSGNAQAQPLLYLLSTHLKGLPQTEEIHSLFLQVQEHLDLFKGQGSLSSQAAFGARQFFYNKSNAAMLFGMAGGMTAFNLARLGFVARGAGAVRAGAQAFMVEGAAFTGAQLGAEAALSIESEQNLGSSLFHAYAMMGIMRGVGLFVGTLTQPLQPVLRHSPILNVGVQTVAPRLAEFGGLATSGMVLEGQDLGLALRSATTGVIHFAALRGLSHGLAPRLAAFNHSLQQHTQAQLYSAGSSWLRRQVQGMQLQGPDDGWGAGMGRRYGVLGPGQNVRSHEFQVSDASREWHLSFQEGDKAESPRYLNFNKPPWREWADNFMYHRLDGKPEEFNTQTKILIGLRGLPRRAISHLLNLDRREMGCVCKRHGVEDPQGWNGPIPFIEVMDQLKDMKIEAAIRTAKETWNLGLGPLAVSYLQLAASRIPQQRATFYNPSLLLGLSPWQASHYTGAPPRFFDYLHGNGSRGQSQVACDVWEYNRSQQPGEIYNDLIDKGKINPSEVGIGAITYYHGRYANGQPLISLGEVIDGYLSERGRGAPEGRALRGVVVEQTLTKAKKQNGRPAPRFRLYAAETPETEGKVPDFPVYKVQNVHRGQVVLVLERGEGKAKVKINQPTERRNALQVGQLVQLVLVETFGGGHDGYKVEGRNHNGDMVECFVDKAGKEDPNFYRVVQVEKPDAFQYRDYYGVRVQVTPGTPSILLKLTLAQIEDLEIRLDGDQAQQPRLKIIMKNQYQGLHDGPARTQQHSTPPMRPASKSRPSLPAELAQDGVSAPNFRVALQGALPRGSAGLYSGKLIGLVDDPSRPGGKKIKILDGEEEFQIPIDPAQFQNLGLRGGEQVVIYDPEIKNITVN